MQKPVTQNSDLEMLKNKRRVSIDYIDAPVNLSQCDNTDKGNWIYQKAFKRIEKHNGDLENSILNSSNI